MLQAPHLIQTPTYNLDELVLSKLIRPRELDLYLMARKFHCAVKKIRLDGYISECTMQHNA